MTRTLTISILSDGTIHAEASGTPGADCLSAIQQLRHLLNAEVSDSKPTPEFTASAAPIKLFSEEGVQMEDRA